ncbi:MAG: tRNA (cytidine(34)-2'-O)-methyltransferase [Candidatus Melainabacteria bacterium]|nr:tRNA (cytidine(34)-2'-O)-methyltransferase [Candidatus Melainabacteria bacterium]MBI3308629.1 tRNA (cytidine(34)-2'-O)-methyltransferase [Candidatus Melainabacteria bacterium]
MVIRSKQKLNISKPFNIVLVKPEIPPNTGNIARLCAATNTKLHLVHPLGFEITDKELKRAGLDYWRLLDIKEYTSWHNFVTARNVSDPHALLGAGSAVSIGIASALPRNDKINHWYFSTSGEKNIWDVEFDPGDYLIFGSETKGLDEKILNENQNKIISIPMNGLTRSINLSTAVGIVLYEALRQVTKKGLFEVVKI